MSDAATTKILSLTANETFTREDRECFAKMAGEMQAAQEAETAFHPSHLARELQHAERGCTLDGPEIETIPARVKHLEAVRRRIGESPFRMQGVAGTRHRIHSECKVQGHKLLTAAVVRAEQLLASPPEVPTPAIFAEWSVPFDGTAPLVQVFEEARRTFAWELQHWSRAAIETGHGWLSRAGCFQLSEK